MSFITEIIPSIIQVSQQVQTVNTNYAMLAINICVDFQHWTNKKKVKQKRKKKLRGISFRNMLLEGIFFVFRQIKNYICPKGKIFIYLRLFLLFHFIFCSISCYCLVLLILPPKSRWTEHNKKQLNKKKDKFETRKQLNRNPTRKKYHPHKKIFKWNNRKISSDTDWYWT